MILTVDPGSKHCGYALFDDGKLWRAWLEENEDGRPQLLRWRTSTNAPTVAEIVVERPQVYPGFRMRGDPNDLVTIALVGGEIVGLVRGLTHEGFASKVTYYYPRSWKGNVDKKEHHPRIMALLSEDEISNIELPRAKALHHNIIDAVGIGLYHVGRMVRGQKKAS